MNLTKEQIASFATGVDHVEIQKTGCVLHRMPAAMEALYTNDQGVRAGCTSGVRLRFASDSRWIKITLQYGEPARWYFLCAVVVDGAASQAFGPVSQQKTWQGMVFTQELNMRRVYDIWLPHLCPVEVRGLEVEDGSVVEAAPPLAFRWLAYGDSITQGMNASLPLFTWPARAAQALDAEVVNLGVGGATLHAELARSVPDLHLQLITISYGANDYVVNVPLADLRVHAAGLLDALRRRYAGVPVVVTTPIPLFKPVGLNQLGLALDDYREALESVVAGRPDVHLVRGTDLVPADHYYFNDWTHPNDQGMVSYSQNILPYLKKLV